MKQKEEVLVCSLLGNIDAIASLLSYLLCQLSAGFAVTTHRFRLLQLHYGKTTCGAYVYISLATS